MYGRKRLRAVRSDRKRRPSQDVRFSQNVECIVGRGTRHKVSRGTIITQLLPHDRWLTRADGHSLGDVDVQHGHLGKSARGAAERRTSRLQYRIDHAGPAKERRRAQEERVQLQVEAPSLIALKRSTRSFELNTPAICQRFIRLPSGFLGSTHGHAGRAAVQERRAEQQHSANARGIE